MTPPHAHMKAVLNLPLLNVTTVESGSGGLSDGAIAGIVVGSVVGGLILVTIVVAVGAAVAMKLKEGHGTSVKSRTPTSV